MSSTHEHLRTLLVWPPPCSPIPRIYAAPLLDFRSAETRARFAGINFTLSTDLGPLDLLGEVAGGGFYDALLNHTEGGRFCRCPCLVVNLAKLIQLKRPAGRPKDFEAIAELERLRDGR